MQIHRQLCNIEKTDLSMTSYFNKVKALTDSFAAAGQVLPDEEFYSYRFTELDAD